MFLIDAGIFKTKNGNFRIGAVIAPKNTAFIYNKRFKWWWNIWFLTDNNSQELYDKLQEIINRVKQEERADYVILLTHIGMDVEQYTSNELLSKLENVDAVLDGHTHIVYNTSTDRKSTLVQKIRIATIYI